MYQIEDIKNTIAFIKKQGLSPAFSSVREFFVFFRRPVSF